MSTSDAPPTVPTQEGHVIGGKYRVERVLGQGGMGVVVAATHLHLEQRVAIKFVLPEALGNAEARERFAREARAAVKLRSEHVARVLDVGQAENGAPFMVMEYLEGADLGTLIEVRGPLHSQESVDYVLQAAEAIAEAHANGIVHRDLKPKNLFVTTAVDGRPLVKVLDFGISKHSPLPGSNSDLSLTKTSTVMGSPNYMSPEQLRSAKLVDARTDIWALGVILYETLTGSVPFVAETVTQLTAMVLQDPPRPIEQLRPDVPPGLARAIDRCLTKDPAGRPQSVSELARLLEPFGRATGVAQRIEQVTTMRSRVGDSSPSATRVGGGAAGGTSVAWGETELASSGRRKGALVAMGLGLATLAILVAGVVIGVRAARAPANAGPAADLTAVPTTRQIELAAPPVSVSAVPAAMTASASATAAASAAAAAAASPLPSPRPHHSQPPPKPRPASTEDLPSERN